MRKSGRPFLLSLHFNAPHWPWEARGDEAESERLRQAVAAFSTYDGGTQETYRRMIAAMDRQIGRVLAGADAHGLTENTIVVFTSDNGGERFADTWPFTGKKTELLEGGLAHSRGDLLAGPHSAGPHDRSGRHQHGLAADVARRRRHRRPIRPIRPTG